MELSSDSDSGSLLWRYQSVSHLKTASRKEKRLVIGHGRLSAPEGTAGPLSKLGIFCCLPSTQVKDVETMKINLPNLGAASDC